VTKLAPLRPSCLPNSGDILTSSNGLRMQKILCSVRKGKQVKKGDDYTVCTTDVATPGGDTWKLQEATRGRMIWHMCEQLDQSMGETCHHYKGDTWHGMTSAGTVADTW
jgi:hypothetical protein